jgi:hypothetical protein
LVSAANARGDLVNENSRQAKAVKQRKIGAILCNFMTAIHMEVANFVEVAGTDDRRELFFVGAFEKNLMIHFDGSLTRGSCDIK